MRLSLLPVGDWCRPRVLPPVTVQFPDHDLSVQLTQLKNTVRQMKGEEEITHLGGEHYD